MLRQAKESRPVNVSTLSFIRSIEHLAKYKRINSIAYGILANSAESDQRLENAASNQVMYCLLTEYTFII